MNNAVEYTNASVNMVISRLLFLTSVVINPHCFNIYKHLRACDTEYLILTVQN